MFRKNEYFRNAIVLEPHHYVGYLNLAIVHLLKGQLHTAINFRFILRDSLETQRNT